MSQNRPLFGSALVAGGLYGAYRWGQNNPTNEAVFDREIERMAQPYAHPLSEIKANNTLHLNALEQRTEKLFESLSLVKQARQEIVQYSPTNGETIFLRHLDHLLSDVETTLQGKLPAYHSDIDELRNNNIRIHWQGELVVMGSKDVKAVRPYEMVLSNWYFGSDEDRAILQHEYATREALRNGEEIERKPSKPLSQERVNQIVDDFYKKQAEKK